MCILFFSNNNTWADVCQEVIALFLSKPSYTSYQALQTHGEADICWYELKSNVYNLAKLYDHTSKGNKWAIKTVIRHTGDLDGGELEDAYRALGESIDIKPQIILNELKDRKMTESQFEQAIVMLPLSLTDNECGKLATLKARKRKIQAIKDSGLNNQKKLAVKLIDKRIERITKNLP